MDPSRNSSLSKSSSQRLSSGCPYLGLREDADTHFSTPSPGNYCHKVKPTEPIHLDHQERSCLVDAFPSCQVFAGEWHGSLPVGIRGIGSPGVRNTRPRPAVAPVVKPLVLTSPTSNDDSNRRPETEDNRMSATEQNPGGIQIACQTPQTLRHHGTSFMTRLRGITRRPPLRKETGLFGRFFWSWPP